DHRQLTKLDTLERREPGTAVGALATPADRRVVVRGSRVLDLGIVVSTKRATHRSSPLASASRLAKIGIDREAPAKSLHLIEHRPLGRTVVVRIGRQPVEDPNDKLPEVSELRRAEAACRRRRRTQPYAGCDRRLFRVE